MKNYLFAILAVVLVGCDNSIDGIFIANDDLSFNGNDSEIMVPSGDYDAEIKFRSKKRIDLVLKQGDSEYKVRFDVPKAISFEPNSSFEISSDLSGQPYTIAGGNETSTEYGEIREEMESCSRSIPVRRCYINQHGNYVCRTSYVTRWGNRRVTVQPYAKTSVNFVELVSLDNTAIMGDFSGTKRSSGQRYMSVGRCFIDHYPYPPRPHYYP